MIDLQAIKQQPEAQDLIVAALIQEIERLREELTLLRFDLPWHELQEIGITDESR